LNSFSITFAEMPALYYKIYNRKSRIEGKGAFAGEVIAARKKIGELGGEIISQKEGRKKVAAAKRVAMVEFGNGKSLDASVASNVLRYINHSCSPNVYMRICYPRVEFYALRQIEIGEEIICNYGLTHHDGKLPCRCGSIACKGFL
jgi:uncharacterized protein